MSTAPGPAKFLLWLLILLVAAEFRSAQQTILKPRANDAHPQAYKPRLLTQTATNPKTLPEIAAKFMRRAKWRHRASKEATQIPARPSYSELQGMLLLSEAAQLPMSKLCPEGSCCYSNSKPIVVKNGSSIKISGKNVKRDIQPNRARMAAAKCIIFGHGSTQLIHIAQGGRLDVEMVILSHGRAEYGAAAHVDGLLVSHRSIFAWNVASRAGAAIYVSRPNGKFKGLETRFVGNSAQEEKGDIHVDKGAKIECFACHYQKRVRVDDIHLEPGEEQHSGLSFRRHSQGAVPSPFKEKGDL